MVLVFLVVEFVVVVIVFDVDVNLVFEVKYDELVLVLLYGEIEFCYYFLDVFKICEYLVKIC